jgi:3-oxoacyl-[acyl-carrier protein] reductase
LAADGFGARDCRLRPTEALGPPMDIGHAMLFLASEGASYVPGQTIIVDGGALLPDNGALMM